MSAPRPGPQTAPSSAPLPGMRVCRRPAQCPYVPAERSLVSDLGRWHSALSSILPGDAGLVSALVGDIAALASRDA